MNKLLVAIVCASSLLFSGEIHSKSSLDYEILTHKEKETLSFPRWWMYFKQIARVNGVWVEETDKRYFRMNYYEEGYYPDEAFEEEYL